MTPEFAVKTIPDAMSDAWRAAIASRSGALAASHQPPPASHGRKRRSGEQVQIPEKLAPHHRPGKAVLRESVDANLPVKD